MPSNPPSPSPEALLAQHRFLRPIVRALLRGRDGEDDVMQEALVRAWQAEGAAPRQPDSWLARIARNLSLDRLRAARRQARMRTQVTIADAAPSPAEVLQSEEQRRRVVQAVLALPQPYRGVVLLRYWEEQSPSAIAERLALPAATVRSQLKRGLAMLRERLDADFGDRKQWIGALAPFAGFGRGGHLPEWVILMTTKGKVGAAVAAVFACCVGLWWLREDLRESLPSPVDDSKPAAAQVVAAPGPANSTPALAPTPAANDRVRALASELTVRGQVSSKGVPYAGLALTLQWFAGFAATGAPESTFALVSDAQGNFTWQGPARLAPGMVAVIAPRQPCKLWCTPELVVPEQRDVVLKVSVLPLDRVLFGRVHTQDGTAIAGAHLDVNLWPETAVTSDAAGRYEMKVPAPRYPLVVRAPGFRSRLVQAYLPAEAMRHEFDVELQPGASIAGRVVDGNRQPIAGAKVRSSTGMDGVDTDADGKFVIDGVALGERHLVTARKSGFQEGEAMGVPGDEPLAIVLQPGLAAELRVVDADRAPIAGASVHLVPNPMSGWTRLGVTQADGRFLVPDLPSRPVDVVVQRFGCVSARRTIDAREVKGEVVIALAKGYAIRGQVVDAAGEPVAGASIYCERQGVAMNESAVGSRSDSDAGGRFEINGLPPEACTLYAYHEGYARAEFAFVGGAVAETTLRIERALAVAGRVVDDATGEPVAAFQVGFEPSRDRPVYLDPVAFQAADGRWRIADWRLPAGSKLAVVITAPGYALARLTVEPVSDPVADQNVARLLAGTRVEGVVRDPATGQPIAGVTVALVTADPRLRPNEGPATDASGRFYIDAVPAGEQRLRLQHADRPETVFGPFVVGKGSGTLEVQPTMGLGVALRGRVIGATDAAGLVVMAFRADGRACRASVRADLTFELTGLGAGPTLVDVTDRAGRSRKARITIGERDVDGFEFPLRAGDGSLRVAVEGISTGQVGVRRVDAPQGEVATMDSVRFDGSPVRIDGLAPGRYAVSAQDQMLRQGSVEVVVGAGEVEVRVVCAAANTGRATSPPK